MDTQTSTFLAGLCASLCAVTLGCGSTNTSSADDDDGKATTTGAGGQSAGAGGQAAGAGGSSSMASGGSGQGAGGSGGAGGAGGTELHGWTVRADVLDFASLGALAPLALFVDPHAAGRVGIEFGHNAGSPWFVIWESGVFSKTFDDDTSANVEFAGFDGGGNFYAFYDPTAGPVIARWPNQNNSWNKVELDVPGGFYPDWPPDGMTVGFGNPSRVGLYSTTTLFDATGKVDSLGLFDWTAQVAQWEPPSLDGEPWRFIRFVPGESNQFLVQAMFSHAIANCAVEGAALGLICTQVGTLPGPANGVWMSPTNPDQVLVRIAVSGGQELLVSHDRGATFTPLALPAGLSTFHLTVSPLDSDTLVLWDNGIGDLHVTNDLAASWTALALPETTITSLSGAGIDSAGTLFLLRGGELFSRSAL